VNEGSKDGRNLGKAVLPDSWLEIFGDVLNTEWTTEKHYPTLEFKVIGIVYIIGYSIVGTR
jgi:hypothetical protein